MEALHQAIQETLPELVRWLPWARPGHRRADTRRYIRGARLARAHRHALEFLLEDAEDGKVLGIVSLHRIDPGRRCGEIGYWVRRSHQGRGLATEAAIAVIDHAFRDLNLHRLELQIAPDNLASLRVADRLGFEREGIARKSEFVDGRYRDHVRFSLLRSDVFQPVEGAS